MTWLTPMIALYAAAAAVPLLVLLYFLKLKRRQELTSSTLLWKRAVRDLQVNAPFQRIRWNLLLLLQLLLLAAVLIALARPVLSLTQGPPKRYVLLIDRSASMNATDADPSRLEAAKKQAKQLVQSLRGGGMFSLRDSADQAMVVAFDEHAQVMNVFTSDKKQLEAAIDSIQPTDGPSSLAEAITVARAFAQPPGAEANNRSSETAAQLELFSDGRIADSDQISLGPGEMNFHRVGKSQENVAVVAMQARRSYEKAEEAEVFATLANYGPETVTSDVQLSVDGNIRSVKAVQVPPFKQASAREGGGPGTVSISFSLTHPQGAVIEVRQLKADALASDDAAWAILPPPKTLSALLVTGGNPALHSALKACPLANLDVMSPAEFDKLDHAAGTATQRYDVIVLDNGAPAKLPRGRFLVFGRPPPASGVTAGEEIKNQVIVDWRSRHPVLQFVNLTNLFAAKCYKMSLPADAVLLAEFNDAPAMALVRRPGSVFLLVGFDCMETNWPFEPGFVMFCYNAVTFLGMEVALDQPSSLRVNQAISLEGLPAGALAKISGPNFKDVEIPADPSGAVRFPGTSRAGVYTVAPAASRDPNTPASPARFAVNLLDARESRIEPAEALALAGQEIAAQESLAPGNQEVWPYLIALALALACMEWFVYNWRMRIR